jgi:cell division protein DivIC
LSASRKNVAKIQTDLTHQHEKAEIHAAKKRKRLIRRLSSFFVVATAVSYFMISTLLTQASSLEKKEAEKAKLQQELAELKKDENVLKEEIVKLNDDEYILKLARRDFFLSEGNEIIFHIPDEK